MRSDGSIYFSDPWYGRMPVYGVERPRQLGFQGVYRVPPGGGQPQLLVERTRFEQPNGLCFSPDEKLLYVNDTVTCMIWAFDVSPDGSLSPGRIFASGIRSELEPGVPDGMKCDAQGNIWVTAPGGVWVYSPSGSLLGKVRVPELVANLAWGGDDFHTLFMTATHSLYTVKTKVGPRIEPYMRSRGGGAASSAQRAPAIATDGALRLDPSRCAMIIQDLQNDVIMEGGAFAASGSPAHAKQQNVVENVRRLADAARARGVLVIHVWFIVEPGAPGMTLNAPLFEGVVDNKAMVRGSWGAAPVERARAAAGRLRGREDAHERLGGHAARDHPARGRARRDHQHRRLDQHVGRAHRAHRGRQGLFRRAAGGLLLDHERRLAQCGGQLCAAERLGRDQGRRGDRGARLTQNTHRSFPGSGNRARLWVPAFAGTSGQVTFRMVI